ncbi:polysaccharide lyase [Leisingera daeponensis]|uniref:polysaccharide lyase n=1 Tax=Leisingera daeponensis TaxID=405746 RepID=UPI001C961F5D|nr:polysaccharide lyase [Leisingera daeponensis]MBY6058079.1 polysaccharide lyase [Leisingera daeponensis]
MALLKCRPRRRAGFILAVAAGLAAGSTAAASQCSADSRHWRFDDAGEGRGFAHVQLQRGAAVPAEDPLHPGNQVARLTAGPKQKGKVGKADYVHRFQPLQAGSVVLMQARFYFPPGTPLNSLILMDLECASCGLDTNPGVRLYLRRGMLRVDRSKIGIKQAFLPSVPHMMAAGVWHELSWQVTLGAGEQGRSVVRLDGEVVSDARGTTVLTQEVVSRHMDVAVQEQADRFQVGVTANSNPQTVELLLDDVRFCQL